jgi:hypothetical protein
MKKYYLFFILSLISTGLLAQKLTFSVIGDPQIAWLKTDVNHISNDGSVFGFNGGLIIDRYFAENYAFSTGIFLWHTGGKLLFSDSTAIRFRTGEDTLAPNTSMAYHLQYLTIPFSLKLHSNEIGYIKFFAHLGINSHINIGKTADVPDMNIDNVGIPDEIQFFSMSYFFGGGIEYSLGGNTAILCGIYYTNGFWDVTVDEDCRTTLNTLSLRLGVRF